MAKMSSKTCFGFFAFFESSMLVLSVFVCVSKRCGVHMFCFS